MKKILILLIVLSFAFAPIFSKVEAFPTQSYLTLNVPITGIASVMPTAVQSLGENFAVLLDQVTLYLPELMIGANGFFLAICPTSIGVGFCNESIFLRLHLQGFQAGLPLSGILYKEDIKLSLDDININIDINTTNLPTKDELQSLKPLLVEAQSSYPQFKEVLDRGLELINSLIDLE